MKVMEEGLNLEVHKERHEKRPAPSFSSKLVPPSFTVPWCYPFRTSFSFLSRCGLLCDIPGNNSFCQANERQQISQQKAKQK